MQTTAVAALSPGRVVDVLDRTFRVYRDNFITFIALAALTTIPVFFIDQALAEPISNDYTTWEEYRTAYNDQALQLVLIRLINLFIQVVIVYGLIVYIASEHVLGRKVSIGEALRVCKGRFVKLAGAWIFYVVLLALGGVVVLLGTGLCTIPIIFMPFVLYLGLVAYFFLAPVLVLENVGTAFGLRRALELGKVRFWPVFGFVFALWLISGVISLAFGSFAGVALSSDSGDSVAATALSLALSTFVAPIMPIGLTMMYYNTRIRVEGLDLALQTLDKPDPRPFDVYSPDPEHWILTGRDVLNVVILAVGFFAIFCGLSALIGISLGSAY